MSGIRVVELRLFALVPSAAAVLAEWGSDVVKGGASGPGRPLRGLAAWGIKPGTGGFAYMWEVCNRGKRSVGVDAATPEGREILLSLAERADVFITSFLPSARRRLGIDVDDVMARNPTIIYGRGSGHGPKGGEAETGGFDGAAYWNRCGIASAAIPDGSAEPIGLPSPGFGDVQTGMHLAGGIAAALWRREGQVRALSSMPRCWPPGCGPCRAAWPARQSPARPSYPSGLGRRTPTRSSSPTRRPTGGSWPS